MMRLKNISKEKAEIMSFDDIAYEILKEKGKKIKIQDLFKAICDILELGENEYQERIADFFTLLSTEKRFIQLTNGYWDLRENHCANIIKDEEDDILEEDEEDDYIDDEEVEDEDEALYSETLDTEDEEVEDDLEDLALVEDEELDEANL